MKNFTYNLTHGIKSIAKRAIISSAIAAASFWIHPTASYAQSIGEQNIFPPTREIESEYRREGVKDFTTTIYGEGGAYRGSSFSENPFSLNVLSGYNIQGKRLEEGVLYLPSFRAQAKVDKPENYWNNYLDLSIGAAYQKAPFIIGADIGHRESFRDLGTQGEFLRLWGGYWNLWENKSLGISEAPNRFWGVRYADFEYNTLDKDLVGNLMADLNWDLLNVKGLVMGPYVGGKINFDTDNKEWNRYIQANGGLRLRKNIFNLFLEVGDRKYFERDDDSPYAAAYGALWYRF